MNEVLARLTPEMLDWAPAEGMRTVRGQLIEIIEVEIPLATYAKESRLPTDEEFAAAMGKPETLEELITKLQEVRQKTLDCLDSLTDAELEEAVPTNAWFGSFWQPELPRAELFLNIAAHELYHIGQLVTYLWLRGDNPYEW